MLFRINTPVKDRYTDYKHLPSGDEDAAYAADSEKAKAITQALSAWMALQSISPAERPSLGIDLSEAPQLAPQTIPLPDEQIHTIQTGSSSANAEAFMKKRQGARAMAAELNDITGLDYKPSETIGNLREFKEVLEGGADAIGRKAVLMVGDYYDGVSDGKSFTGTDKLLIQDVNAEKPAGWEIHLKRGPDAKPRSADHTGERTYQRERLETPARTSVRTVASPKADDAFIAFYTDPALIETLKKPENQEKMITAERAAEISLAG